MRMNSNAPIPPMEARIAQAITGDGSVIIPPRIARWLETQAGMTADRRIRLRDTDPDAYIVLTALHVAALRSDCGPESVVGQQNTEQSETWMSTRQAAKTLGVTDRCVRKWCQNGRLRAVLSGSRWLIDRTSIALQNIA